MRADRHDEALEHVVPLLARERRAGTWARLWTAMRIFAELLASRDRPREAAFLLCAVEAAHSAPPETLPPASTWVKQILSRRPHERSGELPRPCAGRGSSFGGPPSAVPTKVHRVR
ncbi:hypothetical protein E1281_17090 [Actinomadura sp. KC345]|uniref:hypothetical protein n=1 Tax=Actinomadura sp. KC345 TaxID=2530371 RepID=UPI00104C4A20|nr:hypothetical protein [Actinomadura sp. KC345]TDC53897.1 hypothetical protein E1281_17090 [Actinomadura sp. KC345]